ncbi:hypothetical protein AVEN_38971-1 [Araneus ventricosus]|uniref:Uncharacterized protein n=1 Tax=Araneus ventricosus TaxID=182803 RepID=A0A4Y2IHR7_ARAVE|nr:hypothetical protein AVEN_38971-1 [Araneus ventricosus]
MEEDALNICKAGHSQPHHAKPDRQCEKSIRIGIMWSERLDIQPFPSSITPFELLGINAAGVGTWGRGGRLMCVVQPENRRRRDWRLE